MELGYLEALTKVASRLKANAPLEELCSDVCSMICSIMRYSEIAVVKVTIGTIIRMSPGFRLTQWGLVHDFRISDTTSGRFEIYYTEDTMWTGGFPFLKEEEDLLDNLAGLLSGAATKEAFKRLLLENTERLKELGGITRIISILKENKPIQMLLSDVCHVMPDAWQYPAYTEARITYGDLVFSSANFAETPWMQKQPFEVPEGPSGCIEVCYTKEFPIEAEGPFLAEERNLLINLAQLISAAAGSKLYERTISQNRERLKELNAINQTTEIITRGKSIDDTLQSICTILPQALQYPHYTVVRITFEGKEYVCCDFKETPWVLREQFITIDNTIGSIEFFYLQEFPIADEGPFLKEEREMIKNIGRLLAHFLNNYKGRMLLEHTGASLTATIAERLGQPHNSSKENLLFNSIRQGADISFVVREVLFIAAPYEAFAIQSECMSFQFEAIQMHTSFGGIPRITVAHTTEQALHYLSQRDFDLAIVMVGIDLKSALDSYTQMIQTLPMLPVYMLVNRLEYMSAILSVPLSKPAKDNPVFVWNSDPSLIFAIVKLYEDTRNVVYSHAPIILIVEDTPDIVSRIITRLHHELLDWVEERVNNDYSGSTCAESFPHLLVVSNYEAAIHFIRRYPDRICCVISDIEFGKDGKLTRNAGIDFVTILKEQSKNIPCLLHSSDGSHCQEAFSLDCLFLEKGTPAFLDSISTFVKECLQVNILSFYDESGRLQAQVSTICALMQLFKKLPHSSVIQTLQNGAFEKWFAIHGEGHALIDGFDPLRTGEPDALKGLEKTLKNAIRKRFCGTAARFENVQFFDQSFIAITCRGSYGGKGRGASFINSLVNSMPPGITVPGLKLCTPVTAIIGTDEFEHILKTSGIRKLDFDNDTFATIQKSFLEAPLSNRLRENLIKFITQIDTPIAVRSSSLFEDSLLQPFAGAFETYILPNSHKDLQVRLEQLETAVKLVFASLYRPEARLYFDFTGRNIHEERMAVVLQELVGTQIDNYYYPQISGVAGSYNYYPVSHTKPEDGFVVIAFGLGVYVVEGRSGHRFCPAYPAISFGSIKDALTNSQVKFYAVNTERTSINLLSEGEKAGLDLLDISIGEKNGTLKHCASVYDSENDRIIPNLTLAGPRIVDFANILQHDHFPLAESLTVLLKTLEERMGTPVEIEFAVKLPHTNNNLQQPELHVLQVKPLTGKQLAHDITNTALDPDSVVLYSETALGNGVIDTITDIVMVDVAVFDRLRTVEIAQEIEWFNRKLFKENRKYLLIGPGRWGTRDKSLGVPVVWSQISNARVIVELGLENYHLDASLGSHFFHNLTSMGTGYMAINESNSSEIIKWDLLANAEIVERLHFALHYRFPTPLKVEIDGKKRVAVVWWKGAL